MSAWRLFFLMSATAFMALATAAGPVITVEELFKWGEYDSLIRSLEPVVAAPGFLTHAASRADSADHAQSLLYLGVAYYAKGRVDRADTTFHSAFALNPGLELDQFYVTPAIAGHFQALKTEAANRNRERLAGARAIPVPRTGKSPPPTSRLGKSRSWLWWGIGAMAVTTASGGAYWFAMQPAQPHAQVTIVDIRNKR